MLDIDNVFVHYGNVEALSGVSLHVGEGEITALVGANGAGKSTVLRTISGLLRPSMGTISFDGRRIDAMSASAIVRLGVSHCPEERKVWPMMSVRENLELGAYIRNDSRDIARSMEEVFARFPLLEERCAQAAGTLSGGEQQMLAIGRALMSRPQMLLLDEPSLGLSPILVEELIGIIKDIHAQGVTVLLVEQNVRMALGLAGRAYVLETGRNVTDDSSENLLKDTALLRAYLGG